MKYSNIREEELKNRIATNFFEKFDCDKILGAIDFAVKTDKGACPLVKEDEYLLWAEAKQKPSNIFEMLTQLVLIIGKARTFDKMLPPPFLGCYDNEKMAFIPYSEIQDVFYQNDFNWKVAPSDKETREFKLVYTQIEKIINRIPWQAYIFYFDKDEKDLRQFIRENFIVGKTETSKIRIDKNNFINIYQKWYETVKPTISVNWEAAKKIDIIDGDFYLADLMSENNETIKEILFVLLKNNNYKYNKQTDALGEIFREAYFNDNQKAYKQFWAKYERPPLEEYCDYIIKRRDLIVPQDVRERKGSFFTPSQWVELSQKYLADALGVDWQDEYYVWDCAAGTGNLLAGLVNKNNLWASTLDKQDVDVMYDRIENGTNLWKQHVFQFDFLNDDFIPISKGGKLPEKLYEIISDENKRKKLVIYINPPYAETNAKKGTGKGVSTGKIGLNITKQREKHDEFLEKGKRELYAQFIVRIFNELKDCKLAVFSTLKMLNSPFYRNFRSRSFAKLEKLFIIPANSFDNVPGHFPIGFQIWNTSISKKFKQIKADVYDKKGNFIGKKKVYSYENVRYINDWIIENRHKNGESVIGKIFCVGSDFQHQSYCRLNSQSVPKQAGFTIIDVCLKNLIECCVFYAVRKIIPATWLNHNDQFLYPNNKWKKDSCFQNDCLVYTLFHSNNSVSVKYGVNHWIPFTEEEVNASYMFDSHFMISFIKGEKIQNSYVDLFDNEKIIKREFSETATKVFDAGRKLWKYYHNSFNNFNKVLNLVKVGYNVNASLYDIREYFQGRNEKGKMNNASTDPTYNKLIENLRDALKILAQKIEPKVYEYGFLME